MPKSVTQGMVSPELTARCIEYRKLVPNEAADAPEDEMPAPPFPEPDNPMLEFLIQRGVDQVESGEMSLSESVIDVVVHAWMEGHLEGHMRGLAER